jgi:peptidyl-prolyl cis-trans isomerase B (cyclophilin B)
MFIAASDIMFRCVFDGCISVDNMEIERRPYHRNCSCALHKMEGGSSTGFPLPRNMFYPKKQSWRRCSLSLATPSILLAYQLKVNSFSYTNVNVLIFVFQKYILFMKFLFVSNLQYEIQKKTRSWPALSLSHDWKENSLIR